VWLYAAGYAAYPDGRVRQLGVVEDLVQQDPERLKARITKPKSRDVNWSNIGLHAPIGI